MIKALALILFWVTLAAWLVLPVPSYWPDGLYFNIDPDFAYLGNALAFLDSGKIFFDLHPGAPVIGLMSLLNLPFLVLSTLSDTPFATWTFRHIDEVVFYNRLLQPLAVFVGLVLIYLAVRRLTQKWEWSLLAVMAVAQTAIFPISAWAINNENWSFFLVALWFWILSIWLENRSLKLFTLLGFLAGLLFAAKFTTLAVVGATGLYAVTYLRESKKKFALALGAGTLALVAGFFLARLPVQGGALWEWVKNLAFHSAIYGSGKSVAFDWESYQHSAHTLFDQDQIGALLMLAFAIAVGVSKIKLPDSKTPLWPLVVAAIGTSVVFGKFSLLKYQLTSFTLLAIAGTLALYSLFQRQYRLQNQRQVIVLLLALGTLNAGYHLQWQNTLMTRVTLPQAREFQHFLDQQPVEEAVIWQTGRARDYSYFFATAWAGGFWNAQIKAEKPNLVPLVSPMFKSVLSPIRGRVGLFDICWKRMYATDDDVQDILKDLREHELMFSKIPRTEMTMIVSRHCKDESAKEPL